MRRIIRYKVVVKVLFILVLSTIITPLASEELSKKHLRIPVNPFPPWVIESNDSIDGIDIEIIHLLSKELGFTFELVSCPFSRCLKLMESGDGDLMLGLFKRFKRERYLSFVEPGYIEDGPKAFYIKVGSGISIDDYEDIKNLTIGVVRDTSYFPRFDNDPGLTKVSVNHDRLLIRMLNAGRIDTFIGTPSHISYLMKAGDLQGCIVRAPIKLTSSGFSHIGISKQSSLSADLDLISKAVNKLIKLNKIRNIVDEYLKTFDSSLDHSQVDQQSGLSRCKKF